MHSVVCHGDEVTWDRIPDYLGIRQSKNEDDTGREGFWGLPHNLAEIKPRRGAQS